MKVILVGSGVKKRFFDPSGFEVWGLNAIRPRWIKLWDRMFNLHTYENLKRYRWPHLDEEADWSRDHVVVPFYTVDEWPKPHALMRQKIFPREEMAKAMPRGDYHCGSFDWMVAFAVFLKAEEIKLHGVSLVLEAGEPISARACLEYWCGYAEGCGTKVTLAEDSDLFHFYHLVKSNLVYGYDDTPIFEDRTKPMPKEAPYTYD